MKTLALSRIAIGALFTLFVVPAMYMLLAAEHSKKETDKAASGEAV